MPTAATTPTTALVSTLFQRHPAAPPLPSPSPLAPSRPAIRAARPLVALLRTRISCQVAITTDVSSSSLSVAEEEAEALTKIGRRVRVKVPLKVYHVLKAPELDLNGMEGEIKQYVGLWKGKRISANLPFKVEFHIAIEGQPKPVKLFAHLKEDEFEYVPSSD